MKKIYLHVGTEKTGTTSIQNLLTKNRDLLISNGILFPKSLGHENHTHVPSICLDDQIKDNIKAHVLANRNCSVDELREQVTTAFSRELQSVPNCDTIIVSTELIHSRLTQSTEIKRLFDFLHRFAEDIEVVMCLRRQDELAVSRYSSVLRAGYDGFDHVFDDIGHHIYRESNPHRNTSDFDCYFDYRQLISRFTPYVSKEKIKIFIYPENGKSSVKVLDDFLKYLGIDHLVDPSGVEKLNPSMSVEAQFIIAKLNSFMKPCFPNGLRHMGSRELRSRIEREMQGSSRAVAKKDALEFLERFKESNEWVRSEFFPEKSELFHSGFSHYPDRIDYIHLENTLRDEIKKYSNIASKLDYKELPSIKKPNAAILRQRLFPVAKKVLKEFNKCHLHVTKIRKKTLRFLRAQRRFLAIHPLEVGSAPLPYRFALIRILGSDHPPRHSSEQTFDNLNFILENEPDFPGVKKIFIVNRIYDKEAEAKIIKLLEKHQCDYITIPFDPDSYRQLDWDLRPFGGSGFFAKKPASSIRHEARVFASSPKIRYAMNVNGARNLGLEAAFEVAEWALVFDGNCFLSESTFRDIEKSAFSYPYVPYIIVPMIRMTDNRDVFGFGNYRQKSGEEPQIAIHCSAKTHYDEDFPYGFRDKAELLIKLGVSGNWQGWGVPGWLPKIKPVRSADAMFKWCHSSVLRLSSGMNLLDKAEFQPNRYSSRNHAIINSLAYLDDLFDCKNVEVERLVFGEAIQYKNKPGSIDE